MTEERKPFWALVDDPDLESTADATIHRETTLRTAFKYSAQERKALASLPHQHGLAVRLAALNP